jgi:hypothetical protein
VHAAQLFCVLVFTLAVVSSIAIHEAVRSQLIVQLYEGQRVDWRELRSAFDWFGRGGIWSLHHQHFPASRLRLWFAVSLIAMIVAFAFGVVLQAHGIR